MSINALYICYFGLREPLVQTQVLPYLRQLAAANIRMHLLTFEPGLADKWSEAELVHQRSALHQQGIRWSVLPYHKRPSLPATLYDIYAGARFAAALARREGINMLHARAHVPMAMALLAQRSTPVKLIFDIRGLMAEEYVDSGIWKERSLPFRLVKALERTGIRRADQIVVLTERLRDWMIVNKLKPANQIQVIPCCVDFGRFRDAAPERSNSNKFEVVYAGSLLGLYLVEEMGRFFKALKGLRPNAFLRILSVSSPGHGTGALQRAGLNEDDFEITAAAPDQVPTYLEQAHLGISFRKATFAQIAASPTKIPEYLAAGLPVVCNLGIGDMDELVERERVGVVLQSFDQQSYEAAAARAVAIVEDPRISDRARQVAKRYFDLETVGGPGYVDVYRKLREQSQR